MIGGVSGTLDIFASEYGLPPTYVLDELTGPQVRRMLEALTVRHHIQSEALKKQSGGTSGATQHHGRGIQTMQSTEERPTYEFSEDWSDQQMAMMGINVIRK